VGVVSEADLLLKERRHEIDTDSNVLRLRRRRMEKVKAAGLLAADLMTSPPITVHTDATLAQAAGVMHERKVKRLIVVDARGKIAGVVSRSDLLQVFLRSDEEIRAEIIDVLIPALMLNLVRPLAIEVRYNVVTLAGEVDRKSDVDILERLVGEMDGVVGVLNQLRHRWDDTVPVPLATTGTART